jgi:hypothetical protein
MFLYQDLGEKTLIVGFSSRGNCGMDWRRKEGIVLWKS